jgi:hypothetical protein
MAAWITIMAILLSTLPRAAWGADDPDQKNDKCITPPKSRYSVCKAQADNKYEWCWVSHAWCPPFNQPDYYLSQNRGLNPSKDQRLRIILDPYVRSSTPECFTSGGTVDKCIAEIEKGFVDAGFSLFYVFRVSYLVTSLSYFDMTVTDADTASYKASIKILTADVQEVTPICRVFEFSGMSITLKDLEIDVSECTTYYDQVDNQFMTGYTTGDDGAIVVFAGASIEDISLSNIDIISIGGDDGRRAVTTGVRIGTVSQSTVNAKGAVIENVKVSGIDVAFAIWETKDGPTITLTDTLCDHPRSGVTGTCTVLYSGTGTKIPTLGDFLQWTAYNVTNALPPDRAISQSASRGGDAEGTCTAHGAAASAYITGIMVPAAVIAVCIVIISVMTHEVHSMKNSKAFVDRYDDVAEDTPEEE